MLELICYGEGESPFVKITVSSSLGSAETKYIPEFEVFEYGGWETKLFVLTRDSMKSDLDINPLGDAIIVKVEHLTPYDTVSHYVEDVLIFGKRQGAVVGAPKLDESIVYFSSTTWDFPIFSKTNIPSIGMYNSNSLAGAKGTLTGKVYDKNLNLVTSLSFTFELHKYAFVPIEDGIYNFKLFSNYFKQNYIYIPEYNKIKIKTISANINPDEIYERDIYLLEDIPEVGIDEAEKMANSFPFRIFPNPISSGQALNYETELPVKTMDNQIIIVSMDGRIVHQEKITDNSGTIHLSNCLSAGIYMVSFKTNNKVVHSERVVIE